MTQSTESHGGAGGPAPDGGPGDDRPTAPQPAVPSEAPANPWESPSGSSPAAAPEPSAPSAPSEDATRPVTQEYPSDVTQPVAPAPTRSFENDPPPDAPPAGGDPYATTEAPAAYPPHEQAGSFGGYPPPPPGTATRRERRRPGWPGVIGVGVGAAVIASLITAGLVTAQDNNGPGTASSSAVSSAAPAASGPVTSSTAQNPDWVKVAAAVVPSVVSIQVRAQSGGGGEGSGVILDKTGRILTNNHVVAEAAQGGQVAVVLPDGRTFDASLVGNDTSTDLAVIKIDSAPSDLVAINFGNSDEVAVGDPVMAVGNPLGLSGTVTTGIVSATDRPVTTDSSASQSGASSGDGPVVTNAIQTDAAVNPGNSGGALVDVQGRLIGINSSIASLGQTSVSGQSGSIGLGFAIPVNEARDVAEQLTNGGTVQHAWVGVSLVDQAVKVGGAERQAAVLQSVTAGSPAQKAGLEKGDAVIAVDSEPVNGSESLVAQLRERRPGTVVTIKIVRDGQARDVQVTLGTRPAS